MRGDSVYFVHTLFIQDKSGQIGLSVMRQFLDL